MFFQIIGTIFVINIFTFIVCVALHPLVDEYPSVAYAGVLSMFSILGCFMSIIIYRIWA